MSTPSPSHGVPPARGNQGSIPSPIGRRWLRMVWHDLLFLHWPVPATVLHPLLPAGLELDTFQGQAWLAIVPFRMSGIRFRGLPPIPGQSAFPELNVRTYVRHRGCSGVWFFSLDAANPLAVRTARATFHLNYLDAEMSCDEWPGASPDSAGTFPEPGIDYRSRRVHRDVPAAALRVRYRPTGPVAPAVPGSLEHWLIERYSLFAATPHGALLRGDIQHPPWPLQPAEARLEENTMTRGLVPGAELVGAPLVHFARRLEVLATRAKRVG